MANISKQIRDQLRNVTKEHVQIILTQEYSQEIQKKVGDNMNQAFDHLQEYLGEIIGRMQYNLANQVHNANLTFQAMEEVLGTELSKDGKNLGELVKAKRAELQAAYEAEVRASEEAEKAMQAPTPESSGEVAPELSS